MSRSENLKVIIAESAPIISYGLSVCLRRIKGVTVLEAHTVHELRQYTVEYEENGLYDSVAIIVDPSFCGHFDPESFRRELPSALKASILAIETGPLPEYTRRLYDGVVSIIDTLDTIENTISKYLNTPAVQNDNAKDMLSQREKEVVKLAVLGMTNKEIADKLFLSVHTVLTHRRNIARKLEIHSATGLTIYAIVNKIVDLSEVKL